MEMMKILGSCDSSLAGWRGKFPHSSLSNCFEITLFIRILESNYKPNPDRHKVASRGRILFSFGSIETSTSGDVETFVFTCMYDYVSYVKGLLVFPGHFGPYCIARKRIFITWPRATHSKFKF